MVDAILPLPRFFQKMSRAKCGLFRLIFLALRPVHTRISFDFCQICTDFSNFFLSEIKKFATFTFWFTLPCMANAKQIVRMPKLTPSSKAVDVWFEEGMILHEDPTDPSQIVWCNIAEFEARIDELTRIVEKYEDEYKHQPDARIVYCGKQEWNKFLYNIKELLKAAKREIHVGLPLGYLVENAQSRQPVSVQMGLDSGKELSSGLILPR
jgi:hypothetical protein